MQPELFQRESYIEEGWGSRKAILDVLCTEVATPPHARVVPSRPWLRARLPLIFWPLLEFFMAPPLLGGEHEWTSGGLERFSFSVVVLGKLFYGSNIELGRRGHICVAYGSDDRAVSSSVAGRRKNNACSLLDELNPHPTHPQSVSVALSIKTIPFF